MGSSPLRGSLDGRRPEVNAAPDRCARIPPAMAATKGTVEPRLSRGLRDLFSEQMLARHRMIETIRGVYELYGFTPLGTPAIEYLEALTGSAGQETQQAIFTVANPEGEALGLRFDLTVPLARVVAQYHDLPRPYRP